MNNIADRQTSAEVAHEAEDMRAGLAHTLQQLRENLKPEHVIGEVVDHARAGAETIADTLSGVARQHPLPALLIGAGCALIFGLGSKTALRGTSRGNVAPSGQLRRSEALNGTIPVPMRALRTLSAGDALGKIVGDEWGTRSPYRKGVSPKVSSSAPLDAPHKTETNAMKTSIPWSQSADRTPTSRLSGVLHEQPLILAALGVAVGAAIGAALPITAVEEEWMGTASSSVKHKARDAARSEMNDLKAVVSRTADTMRQGSGPGL